MTILSNTALVVIPDPRLTPYRDGYDYWREQMYLRGEDWRALYPPPIERRGK